jgi:hypothetical protein
MYTVLMCLVLATANCANILSQNHFPEPNRHILTFSINFYCADHILSTTGDALRPLIYGRLPHLAPQRIPPTPTK